MACEGMRRPGQSIQDRAAEVRFAIERLTVRLVAGTVRVIVGKNGAVAFEGWNEMERNGITDACAYRRVMSATGNALAKAKIAQAETLAGRTVDRRVIATGTHSHDGGRTWSTHKH